MILILLLGQDHDDTVYDLSYIHGVLHVLYLADSEHRLSNLQ